MKEQIRNQSTSVEVDATVGPDITDLLSQIRTQYEDMVLKNKNEAEQWYKVKVTTYVRKIAVIIGCLQAAILD